MTISKIDNNPNWVDVINQQTVFIQKFEAILADEFARKRASALLGSLVIVNSEVAKECVAAYQKRMEAYYNTSQLELALHDANHLLSFEPENEVALKLKLHIQNSLSTPQRTCVTFYDEAIHEEKTNTTPSNKRPYPFFQKEVDEITTKKPCYFIEDNSSIEMSSTLLSDSPFLQDSDFIPLSLEVYPEIQASINALQDNPMDSEGLTTLAINTLTSSRKTQPIEKDKPYKKEANNILLDLAKRNELGAIKKQFKDIAIEPAGNNYQSYLTDKLFLSAVKNNARDTANFFGLPKVRLLERQPTLNEAKTILAYEIYLYRNEASNLFVLGYKKHDGTPAEIRISDDWNKTITTHLKKCLFKNELYFPANETGLKSLSSLLTTIHKLGADLPFRVFANMKYHTLQDAINTTLQNEKINVGLLGDLTEYASLYRDYPKIGGCANERDSRNAHLLRYLFLWSIRQERFDLVLLLSSPPFEALLTQEAKLLPVALKTSIKYKSVPITHSLLTTHYFTSEQRINAFWYAFKTVNVDHLNYFMSVNELMDLVGFSAIELRKNTFQLQENNFKTQVQFILSALTRDKIKHLTSLFDFILITSRYPELTRELVEWFIENPAINPFHSKPSPDNAVFLAISTNNSPLLQWVANKYSFKKEWFNSLLNETVETLSYDEFNFLMTMMRHYYSPFVSSYKAGLINPYIYQLNSNVMWMALASLSEYLYVHPDSEFERKLFNLLMHHCSPAEFFNEMLNQKWYQASLKAVIANAFRLEPQDLKLERLKSHPAKNEMIHCMLDEPSLYNKLTPAEWLSRIHFDGLDSFNLRLAICKKDFYSEFFKLWMLKQVIDKDIYVPIEVWFYMALLTFQDMTHLLETSITVCDELPEAHLELSESQTIRLHYHEDELDLVFKDENNHFKCIRDVQLQHQDWQLAFFAKPIYSRYTALYPASAASKQEIVDIVKAHQGQVPKIRHS